MRRVDLPVLDPQFKSNPHELYDALRRTGRSVVPVRLPTGVEAWLVIGHAAARQLLNDPRLSKGAARRPPQAIFHHLLTMDPPNHTRLRAIVAKEFSPQRIRGMRPAIEAIANGLLDDLMSDENVDLIDSFALPLPLTVICELLALPKSDEPRVRDWSARLLDADLEHPDRVPRIAQELQEYLGSLAQAKRNAPDEGLLTALVKAVDRGELSETELMAMVFLLLVAGHETTVNLIANGVLALLRHPQAWRALCADPSLAAAAVEELLRYDSPLEVATPRTAVSDFSVDDVQIRAGETVFVGLGAANRDDDAFADPARLDLHRRNAGEHLAFGHGIHFCLGAALARLEGEMALTALVRRFPDLALAVPAEQLRWKPGLIMRGLERLPVSVGASYRSTSTGHGDTETRSRTSH